MAFAALWIGSLCFAGLGLLLCLLLPLLLMRPQNLNTLTKGEMLKLIISLVTTTIVCLWLFWIVVYMSQMYPLIAPERSSHQ
ncbi:hypothetical protein, conserved [Eimeria tenella]|uniref:Uncharacterized protein n=1 Tax=Eimeria tenella TaxID=5802 RepID=U6L2V0_EIMTE|nr:hypothetical protein, conserved [Eimeria tenella]CDJ44481.1 hypothetical protein, conserved [Eimeria tenella]|eukprot:XP_013235230.1 hypothetical protein, conserved [Eimeria tenella]